ncbi:NADP-dependent oxidoreductase [Flexivirga alba]|uniref:NADP-dependent oxidoreductase n=1 Tax=Flexivirga alba TaxID=702742 RepID=A0ABW2ABQ7_9MICO
MKTLVSQSGSQPRIVDAPDAAPSAGEVVITVEAAAVNPADLMVASGAARNVFQLPESVGIGWDVAGLIAATGDGVTDFEIGDRVAAMHDNMAAAARSHADRVVVPAASVAHVPADLKTEEAATVPLNALTAQQALRLLGRSEGRRLLVTGAAGGVGGYAIALAAADGWQVDGLARESDRAFVESTGAQLVTSAGPEPYDAILDAASLGDIAALRDGGDYLSLVGDTSERGRGIRALAVGVHADGAALTDLLARSATGELRPRVAATYPFEDHAAAYADTARPGSRGRVLLLP